MKKRGQLHRWIPIIIIALFTHKASANKNCQIYEFEAEDYYAAGDYMLLIQLLEGPCDDRHKYMFLYLSYAALNQFEKGELYLDTLAEKYPNVDKYDLPSVPVLKKAWSRYYESFVLRSNIGINMTQPSPISRLDSINEIYRPIVGFIAELKCQFTPVWHAAYFKLETGLSVTNRSYAYQRKLNGPVSFSGKFGRWDVNVPLRAYIQIEDGPFLAFGGTLSYLLETKVNAEFPQEFERTSIQHLRKKVLSSLEVGVGSHGYYGTQVELRYNVGLNNLVRDRSTTEYIEGFQNIAEQRFILRHTLSLICTIRTYKKLHKPHDQ